MILAQSPGAAVVPASVLAADVEQQGFARMNALGQLRCGQNGVRLLESNQRVRGRFHPGGCAFLPGPAFKAQVAARVDQTRLRQRSPPQFRFRAGRLQEVGYALHVGSVHLAAEVRQGQTQGRAPARNRRAGGGGPASVGLLPGFDQGPGTISGRIAMEHQGSVEGRLQPRLLAAVIAPAAIGILGAPEDVQAHSQIGINHENRSAQSALSVRSKEGSGTIRDFQECSTSR